MSQHWQLADLDELLLLCRSADAKTYIAEAVACYRAGSFRACILTTWIAIVFDYIDKLRQLAMSGDTNAESYIKHLDSWLRDNNVTELLKFERNILAKAKDEFEFISQLEYDDLLRILQDRDKCAHPAMRSVDEPYYATAETARCHLRNAITHLLQHPPAHGKSVLDRLVDQVKSSYFPDDKDKAATFFLSTPLVRPRAALLRNFVIVLIKSMLDTGSANLLLLFRYIAALQAVSKLHSNEVQQILEQNTGPIVARVSESQYARVIETLYYMPEFWQYIQNDVRLKLEAYVELLPEKDFESILWIVFRLPIFKRASIILLDSLEEKHFSSLIADYVRFKEPPPIEIIDKVVDLYGQATSFSDANYKADLWLIPINQYFQKSHVMRILKAVGENPEVAGSFELEALLRSTIGSSDEFRNMVASGLDELKADRLRALLFPEDPKDIGNLPF